MMGTKERYFAPLRNVSVEQLVPHDHFYRHLERTLDLAAEAKDWHRLRRFRLRLLWCVNSEALRIAAGQNLKRLLKKRGWGRRPFPVEALCASFWLLLCAVLVLPVEK